MRAPAEKNQDSKGASPPDRERRGIQSIEVGGEILSVLASEPRPMALKDLTKTVGMPSGKIHPYLVSFGKIGLVAQDPVTGQYLLGPMAIQLGLTGLQTLDPMREATPLAETLAAQTGHTVAIAVWGNLGPVIVRLIDAAYPIVGGGQNPSLFGGEAAVLGDAGIRRDQWQGPRSGPC